MSITLPKLPYAYDSLEPWIDAKTMEIHHTKHHQTYVDKLNEALAKHPALSKNTVEYMLRGIGRVPEDIRLAVRNHGGGHLNHSLFWELMTPDKKSNEFAGIIAGEIVKTFKNFELFKDQFAHVALGRFGSGWAWLVMGKNKKLEITSTPNQDSVFLDAKTPLLGLDVWEHAYYLKYQNKRSEYVAAFWNVVNWKKVEELYLSAMK